MNADSFHHLFVSTHVCAGVTYMYYVFADCVFADMDMCNTVEHGCEHQCVSTPGSYYCICPEGQLLQEDGKSCGSESTI